MPVYSARVSKMTEGKESWERAKKLLLGAVDVVLQMKEKNTDGEASGSSLTQDESDECTKRQRVFTQAKPGASSSLEKKPTAYEEHRRLFGYQPSKVCFSKRGNRKGKGKKKAVGTWTREVICLKDSDQECSPSTEEKIELAQLNLGLRKLVFSAEGDAAHIHDVILEAFPILDECGGYTLMRVSENSRDLVGIEGPDGGVTVPFLKDILRQAKLYVRPLQCDIPEEKLKALNKEAKEVNYVYL